MSERPECLRRLLHDGEEGIESRGVLDVVEADERHIVGDLEPDLAHRLDRAEGDEIVDREYRGGGIVQLEEPLHALEAPTRVDGGLGDNRRIEHDAGRPERGLVAPPAVASSRDLVRLHDEADPAVAKRDQVLHELVRATHAVAEDGVDVDPGHRPADQDERDTELGEPKQVALDRSLTGAIAIPSTLWAIISSITSRSMRRSPRVSQRMMR